MLILKTAADVLYCGVKAQFAMGMMVPDSAVGYDQGSFIVEFHGRHDVQWRAGDNHMVFEGGVSGCNETPPRLAKREGVAAVGVVDCAGRHQKEGDS